MTKFFHIGFLTLAIILLPSAALSQNVPDEVRITFTKAPKSPDGKGVVEKAATESTAAILKPPPTADTKDLILAAVFEQNIGKDQAFRVSIDNRSSRGWSLLVVEMSADKECNSVLPFRKLSAQGITRDADVPVIQVASNAATRSEWLNEETPGTQRYAILASPTESKLRSVFMSVEFLAGLSTGRAAPNTGSLAELKIGQPKGKSEAYADYRVAGQQITITLGNVYGESGDVLRPAEYYDALMLVAGCRYQYDKGSVPFDALRVGWLNNKALANYQTGNLAEAKRDYETALELVLKLQQADSIPRNFEKLVTTTNLAQVYATLGDQKAAIKLYREAEQLAMKQNPSVVEQQMVSVYGGLGTSLEFEKKYDEALIYYTKAHALTTRHRMDASEGIVLNSLGRLAAVSGNRVDAEKYFQQAITVSERTRNQAGIGSASNNLGWFYVQDKRYADAHAAFMRSSEIFSDLGNRTAQATALGNLMFVEGLQNRPEAAVYFGKRAVRLLQSVRGGLTGVEKQLQRSFLLSREETYRTLADILISLERLAEAEEVVGLLKEQEYATISATRDGPSVEFVPYNDAEESLQEKIDEVAFLRKTRADLQAERNAAGTAFTKQAELDGVDKSIGLVNAAFRRSLERLASTEASVSDRIKTILGERNLQAVLSKLKKDHATEAVAVYTVIGTEDVRDANGNAIPDRKRTKFGWTVLVTPTDRKAYPIDVTGLEESVRRFREALASDTYDASVEAKKLYTAIFRQTSPKQRTTLEKDLEAALAASDNKTVMWSLDSVLRYVPIAALHDGKNYLVEKYRSVVFTPQSLTQLQAQNDPNWTVLGLGVSEARPGFDPLSGAKQELEYIVQPGMFDGTILLNDKFTKEETLRVWRDKKFPVIHIASHFKFHSTKPEESYLLLGDGELRISDIQNEDNLFDGVDLLALSACDTAMSNNGKESESFAYLAQDLGAKTVLASLWPVSDIGTPELMTRFYAIRSANKSMTKGETFHRAQLSMVRGEPIEGMRAQLRKTVTKPDGSATTEQEIRAERFGTGARKKDVPLFVADPRRPFAHPFYWAPFILIGNWK